MHSLLSKFPSRPPFHQTVRSSPFICMSPPPLESRTKIIEKFRAKNEAVHRRRSRTMDRTFTLFFPLFFPFFSFHNLSNRSFRQPILRTLPLLSLVNIENTFFLRGSSIDRRIRKKVTIFTFFIHTCLFIHNLCLDISFSRIYREIDETGNGKRLLFIRYLLE